ncbi:OmpA family protein [Hyphococcus sp.]|uniref:OmpA family protein n=2 Tax=Hyphococcus sp. TaxID=2038636 RepID=UPI0035C73492
MNAVLKFFLGLLAVALLGVAAMTVEGTPGSADSAREKLLEKAQDALAAEKAGWAAVRLDGQKAVLTGEAPSEEARASLIAAVATAGGPGGLLSGGVTAVDASGLIVSPPLPRADPFIFIAEREGGVLSFSGAVPDQTTRDAIYRLATDLFPEAEISGALEIAAGAPASPERWLEAAAASLRALSHLRKGVAEASDGVFALTGEAQDEARAAAARSLMQDFPAGLEGDAEITIRRPPSTIEDIISQAEEEAVATESASPAVEQQPEAAADEEAEAGDETQTTAADDAAPEDDCADRIGDILSARRIGFNSARADIDNRSREQLREIAALLADCPGVRLEVTGHTDSSGNTSRNRQLSGYRADAVRAFLISVGAPANRISARGVGSSEPIASNATPAGREQNRRIEMEVIGEN